MYHLTPMCAFSLVWAWVSGPMHAEILQTSSACVPPPFWKDEIKKAQHRWRCAPLNILTQGSSLCLATLGYQKRNPYGVRLSSWKTLSLRPLPFEREVPPDMVFVISYSMWLRKRVNPTGVPFFIGQGWRAKRVTLPTNVCEWATPSVLRFLWIWMDSYFVFRISADEIKKAQHWWRWKGHIKWWYIVFIVRISMIMHYNRRINANQ